MVPRVPLYGDASLCANQPRQTGMRKGGRCWTGCTRLAAGRPLRALRLRDQCRSRATSNREALERGRQGGHVQGPKLPPPPLCPCRPPCRYQRGHHQPLHNHDLTTCEATLWGPLINHTHMSALNPTTPAAAAAGASGAAGPLPRRPELQEWVNSNAAATDRIADCIEMVSSSWLIV